MSDRDVSDQEASSEGSGNGHSRIQHAEHRNTSSNEIELATRLLRIQHKRFYLDVKQNKRGKFIKIAEVGAAGRKSRLLLVLETALELRNHLTAFSEYYASLGPIDQDQPHQNEKLKTESIVKDSRLYYLDLKENSRGRYLRVTQIVSRGPGTRTQIAIPAQGLIEFRDTLSDLLVEYMLSHESPQYQPQETGDDSSSIANKNQRFEPQLPESCQMRVDNKKFFFDIGQNSLGVYMRISEVRATTRSTLTIPEKSWTRFRDTFNECLEKMNKVKLSKPQDHQVATTTQKIKLNQQ